jgi:hypothetical protein
MKRSLKRVSLTVMALLFMVAIFSCGEVEAPYGSEIVMPSDTSIETDSDVIFNIDALVVDPNGNPLNEIDVEFFVCCEGGTFVDSVGGIIELSLITVTTDEWGIAQVRVLVYGGFEGDVIVSASSGAHGAQTTISKTIPAVL